MSSNKSMYAIRVNKPNDFEYCKVPVPEPGPYEVLCRVETVAICGTDPHIIKGDFPNFWPKKFPFIPGHEWSGVIVELNELSGKFGWKKNDRVCGISHVGCGYCSMCQSGRFNLCLNYGNIECPVVRAPAWTVGANDIFLNLLLYPKAVLHQGDYCIPVCIQS